MFTMWRVLECLEFALQDHLNVIFTKRMFIDIKLTRSLPDGKQVQDPNIILTVTVSKL